MRASTRIFDSPEAAMAALSMDKLGTVYYRAGEVFVATAYGTGTFTYKDWRAAQGYQPSVQK